MRGYLTVAHWQGAPLRIHWTAPLGALVFSWFRFVPAFWAGFVLLIVVHELGHAIVVRACGQRVQSIDVHALGGLCRWSGEVTPLQRGAIAWGGIWAQLVLLVSTLLIVAIFGQPTNVHAAQIVSVFTYTSLFIMAFNLLPMQPLDGVEAWPVVGLLYRRFEVQRQTEKMVRAKKVEHDRIEKSVENEVEALDALDDQPTAEDPMSEEARDLLNRISEEIKSERKKNPENS